MQLNYKILVLSTLIASSLATNSDTIYKHVDDHGSVKFTDKPNADAKKVAVEKPNVANTPPTKNIEPPPLSTSIAESTPTKEPLSTTSQQDAAKDTSRSPSLSRKEKERAHKQAELDAKCEAARQQAMIPKKQKIYKECMEKKKKKESVCWKDADNYNGTRGVHKPLYYNLPECEAAFTHKRSYRSAD
jgi:hypothetical protein